MKVNQQSRVLKYNRYPMNETSTATRNPVFEVSDQVRNKQVCPITLLKFTRGATQDDFSGHFFSIFEIISFCFVVAICDLVHDVETIFHLSYVLTAS